MGCGPSAEPTPVLEEVKEGEFLIATKDLWLWEDERALKQLTMCSKGALMKVLGTEIKEGPGHSGFIKVECMKMTGWLTIWAKGGSTGNGPKQGFVMRKGEGGPSETLAKMEPAAPVTEVKETAMGA